MLRTRFVPGCLRSLVAAASFGLCFCSTHNVLAVDGGAANSKAAQIDSGWPGGTHLHGRVLDPAGHPCVGAKVLLLGNERIIVDADRLKWFVFEGDRHRTLPATETDERGEFDLSTGGQFADRIVVISSDVLLWEVSRKAVANPNDVTIRLPKPVCLWSNLISPKNRGRMPCTSSCELSTKWIGSRTSCGFIWPCIGLITRESGDSTAFRRQPTRSNGPRKRRRANTAFS